MPGNTTFFAKASEQKITWKDIFSNVFKKHNKEDAARLFMAGTALSTPHESRMLSEWRKPWVFAYAAIFGVAFIALMFVLQSAGGQSTVYLIPLVFVGASVMPLAVLLFTWEMNIPRNIPIYSVLGMFLAGGALSLIFTFVLHSFDAIDQFFRDGSAHWAPLTEEPGKLLALCAFLWIPKYKYTLNGILIGAAVGAGFAAIETMDYAFFRVPLFAYEFGIENAYINGILLMRGILSPGGHVVWSALFGGALARAKGAERLHIKHFADKQFLLYFALAFALHFAWNHASFKFFSIPIMSTNVTTAQGTVSIPIVGFDVAYILLIAIAWYALLRLIKQGVTECMRIPQTASMPQREPQPAGVGAGSAPPYAMSQSLTLRGLTGMYKGSSFSVSHGKLVMGRDAKIANIVYPPNTRGISSVHCEIRYEKGTFVLIDKNSSNGTFLADGTRLTPEKPYPLARKSGFYLATRENMFEIK